jgi:hypothetical protein
MQIARFTGTLAMAALFAAGAGAPALAQGHDAHAAMTPSGPRTAAQNELVETVRRATARFRNVTDPAGPGEGYELMFGCVSGGDFGAMGLHYVNSALVGDGEVDASHPEIILFEPTSNGRIRITGADFLVIAAQWDATHAGPPSLNGQLFHYFEAPNRFGLPAFYTLHVWAWKDNPMGTFTNWNPRVSCDGFNGVAASAAR